MCSETGAIAMENILPDHSELRSVWLHVSTSTLVSKLKVRMEEVYKER